MPKTLREQLEGKCKHFNGTMNDKCKVGIAYIDVRTAGEPGKGWRLPCLLHAGAKPCDKCEVPTKEEVQAELDAIAKQFEQTSLARAAIVAKIGKPWKKGDVSVSGTLECPACGKGTLHYSRAGSNGHIHARCTTPDCVSWME